jgi:cellulose biosynthesis protein BcsQ
MFDSRSNLAKDVVEEIQASFPGQVFETVIPEISGWLRRPARQAGNILRHHFARGRSISAIGA